MEHSSRARKKHKHGARCTHATPEAHMALTTTAVNTATHQSNLNSCRRSLQPPRPPRSTIRKSNPRIREALDTLAGCGEAVLLAAGFVPGRGAEGNDTLIFPGAGADLRPLTLVNAKLQQLIAHKVRGQGRRWPKEQQWGARAGLEWEWESERGMGAGAGAGAGGPWGRALARRRERERDGPFTIVCPRTRYILLKRLLLYAFAASARGSRARHGSMMTPGTRPRHDTLARPASGGHGALVQSTSCGTGRGHWPQHRLRADRPAGAEGDASTGSGGLG